MKKYISIVFIGILSFQMIIFGLNKFLGFANPTPPTNPVALNFLGAMFTSYLASLVGFFEILGGMLLLFKRTSFIGLLFLTPIILNIVVFHLAHDFVGNGIWIFTLIPFLIISYLKKEQFIHLINI